MTVSGGLGGRATRFAGGCYLLRIKNCHSGELQAKAFLCVDVEACELLPSRAYL